MNLGFSLGLGAPRRAVSSDWTPPAGTYLARWFDGRDLTAAMGSTLTVDLPDRQGVLPAYAPAGGADGLCSIEGTDAAGRWIYAPKDATRRLYAPGGTSTANAHVFALVYGVDLNNYSSMMLAGNGSAYGLTAGVVADPSAFTMKLVYSTETISATATRSTGSWLVVELETAGSYAAGGTRKLWIDGALQATVAISMPDFTFAYIMGGASSMRCGFRMAELQVYDISGGTLSAPDLASIRAHLADRAATLQATGL
jgi:hypothetical protein